MAGSQTCYRPYRNSFFREDELPRDYAGVFVPIKENSTPTYTLAMSHAPTPALASRLHFTLAPAIPMAKYTDKNL